MNFPFTTSRLAGAALTAALLAGTAIPAQALDAEAFVSKLNEGYAQSGGQIEYGSAETDGDTIILKDAKLLSPGQEPIDTGDLTFEGVEETGDGGYRVDTVRIDDFAFTEDKTSVTMGDIKLSGLTVPATVNMESLDNLLFYDSFSTGELVVTHEGKEVFSIAGINGTLEKLPDGSGIEMTASIDGMLADLTAIDDAKARQALDEFGYDKLTGDVEMAGRWELETGLVDLSRYAITFDDVGALNITLKFDGYTLEFAKALQQAQAAAAKNPDEKAAQEAMGMAMMGMMQQLNFHGATISFDDASLTRRALDFAGKQQGISGEQMKDAAKAMLPLMVGQLGVPALQQQITAAASTFLDNPESLTISAQPAAPVPVTQIMGAGMSDPKALVELLNVQVTAND